MCTGLRFTDDQGNLYFGRNLDVGQDYGEGVIITPRNYPLPYKFLDNTTTKRLLLEWELWLMAIHHTLTAITKMD